MRVIDVGSAGCVNNNPETGCIRYTDSFIGTPRAGAINIQLF
jgi:hypothetical protein